MMILTDDPLYDYESYDKLCRKFLDKRPICCQCGEHIQDEYGYDFNGDWYCENCINTWRKWINE